jgi:hypothetical protein
LPALSNDSNEIKKKLPPKWQLHPTKQQHPRQHRVVLEQKQTMASETEPETTYKEAPFADENREEIPAKVHIVAPGTLPEGYVFDAEVGPPGDKKTISVEVVSCCYQLSTDGSYFCISGS